MKQEVKDALVQLKKEELQKLCCEVRETIATGIAFSDKTVKQKQTTFRNADLWSLQRRMKRAGNSNITFIVRG